jgi:hypothetical protein
MSGSKPNFSVMIRKFNELLDRGDVTKYHDVNMNDVVTTNGGNVTGMKRSSEGLTWGERMMGEYERSFNDIITWSQLFDFLIENDYYCVYNINLN